MMMAMINTMVMALMWILMTMMKISVIDSHSVHAAAGVDADAEC